jgi:DNA-binding SARP family transcriptional activator
MVLRCGGAGRPGDRRPSGHPAAVALARERDTVTLELADAALATGRVDQVLPYLFALAQRDPLHGAAHARLMLALAGRGEQAAALRVFDRIRGRLAEELGVAPDPELVTAQQRILQQEHVPSCSATTCGDVARI